VYACQEVREIERVEKYYKKDTRDNTSNWLHFGGCKYDDTEKTDDEPDDDSCADRFLARCLSRPRARGRHIKKFERITPSMQCADGLLLMARSFRVIYRPLVHRDLR